MWTRRPGRRGPGRISRAAAEVTAQVVAGLGGHAQRCAWASGADPDIPERILIAAGARQWALTLAELCSEAHKTTATVRMVMSRALSFMADPALAANVLPGPGEEFDIPYFLGAAGTVYMIAKATTEDAPVAPLFAAMAAEIHYAAAMIGQASPSRRPHLAKTP